MGKNAKSPQAILPTEKVSKVECPLLPDYKAATSFFPFFTFENEPPPVAELDEFEDAPEQIAEELEDPIARLRDAVWHGNKEAAKLFTEFAFWMCDEIEEMERFIPGIFDGNERKTMRWPMSVAPGPASSKAIKLRLEKLGVGLESPFRVSSKGKQVDFFARFQYRLLIRLYLYLNNVRELRSQRGKFRLPDDAPRWISRAIALPALKKKTASKWFAVMWDVIMHATEGMPEKRADLKSLGWGREFDSELEGHKNPPLGTRLAKIRNGIKARLKRDFQMMLSTYSQ